MRLTNLKYLVWLAAILFSALCPSRQVFAQNKGMTFQAMIKDPLGNLVTASNLTVNAKILAPNGCILREESFSSVSITGGYMNLAITKGTVGGSDPGLSAQKVFDNSSAISSLTCINVDGSVNGAVTSYAPAAGDARKLRISFTNGADNVVADFNMRSVAFAANSETLNGLTDTGFVKINNGQSLNQANAESIFARFTKLDNILNNFNAAGTSLGANITGNAATATTATNVSGTVAIINGGTGATTAADARTNLGLGPLAVMNPTGTANNTTYLRGDGTLATVGG